MAAPDLTAELSRVAKQRNKRLCFRLYSYTSISSVELGVRVIEGILGRAQVELETLAVSLIGVSAIPRSENMPATIVGR